MTTKQHSTTLSIPDVGPDDDDPKSEWVYLLIMGAFLLTVLAALFSFIKILTRLL